MTNKAIKARDTAEQIVDEMFGVIVQGIEDGNNTLYYIQLVTRMCI